MGRHLNRLGGDVSDYPCPECQHEGRGPFAHKENCSRQEFTKKVCECKGYYLRKGQTLCEDCQKIKVFDFRGKTVRVGVTVAYAGRKPSWGQSPRGSATLVLCKVTAVDPVVKRVFNQGHGPKLTLQPIAKSKMKAKTISTRDMSKIAVVPDEQ
jgi:hypothetical protein